MKTLEELRQALQSAEEGSTELDLAIYRLLSGEELDVSPWVTRSVDTAQRLIDARAPETTWEKFNSRNGVKVTLHSKFYKAGGPSWTVTCKTLPLALMAALVERAIDLRDLEARPFVSPGKETRHRPRWR